MASIEERVEKLIQEPIKNLGYEIYDVQYVKEGKEYYLRIFIDKQDGLIDLNDCEKVSNEINDMLDESNLIKDQYYLEVSSTGIERIIRKDEHLKKNIDDVISIKLFKPIDGKKEFIGKLIEFNENEIKINIDNKELIINRKDISLMKKYYEW